MTASDRGLRAGSRVIRGDQAGSLDRSDCGVKLPVASPYLRRGEIWGGSRPVRGGQAAPACAADMETEVLVARGAPEHGLPPLVGHVSVGGVSSGTCYSCGLSTATIEYSSPSVCLCVCVSVYTITQKIMVQST